MQRVHSLWVCLTLEGVIENGSTFKSWTHTSWHSYFGVAPPPPDIFSYLSFSDRLEVVVCW